MGRDYSLQHAAILAQQLPEDSRILRAWNPDVWPLDRQLLAVIANNTNWLVWSKTKDGQKGRNRPKPIQPSSREKQEQQDAGREKRITGISLPVDDYLSELKRIRKGVG